MLTKRSVSPRALSVPLAMTLALLLVVTAAAQSPDPVGPRPPNPLSGSRSPNAGQSAAAINLAEPGLSYRYVETFGETEVAYYEDTGHLYAPYGLGSRG